MEQDEQMDIRFNISKLFKSTQKAVLLVIVTFYSIIFAFTISSLICSIVAYSSAFYLLDTSIWTNPFICLITVFSTQLASVIYNVILFVVKHRRKVSIMGDPKLLAEKMDAYIGIILLAFWVGVWVYIQLCYYRNDNSLLPSIMRYPIVYLIVIVYLGIFYCLIFLIFQCIRFNKK